MEVCALRLLREALVVSIDYDMDSGLLYTLGYSEISVWNINAKKFVPAEGNRPYDSFSTKDAIEPMNTYALPSAKLSDILVPLAGALPDAYIPCVDKVCRPDGS